MQQAQQLCKDTCKSTLCQRMQQELKLFNFMADADFEAVAPAFTCHRSPAQTLLWQEGSSSETLFFIVKGKIELTRGTEFSERRVVLGIYGRGAIIGESALQPEARHATTATALTEVELILLKRSEFDRLIVEQPALGNRLTRGILSAVTTRLHKTYARLSSIF